MIDKYDNKWRRKIKKLHKNIIIDLYCNALIDNDYDVKETDEVIPCRITKYNDSLKSGNRHVRK